ncbi:MAG: alpha/beta hydrolase [Pseudomonadota bacterium]
MDVGFETLNGQQFTVRRWGDPALPPLLMLHGFPEYGGAWAVIAERLCHRFHCIAPDQRGYGASYAPPEVRDYALQHLVADVAALVRDRPAVVLGHDWGASVAYGLAMFRPECVARLIVVNGVHPVPFQRALAAGGAQSAASQYINLLRRDNAHTRLEADDFARMLQLFSSQMDMQWLRGAALAAQKAVWQQSGARGMVHWYRASPLVVAAPGVPCAMPQMPLDRLHVRCPHLLIWGERDTALLPEATRGLEEFAPETQRISVADADHWICHQHPDRVAREVLAWCGSDPVG